MTKNTLSQAIFSQKTSKNEISFWWLGQSGFLIKNETHYILIDPYLSDSITKLHADSDRPHNRIEKIVIDPEELNMVDMICVTHAHLDHLDNETIIPIIEKNDQVRVIVPCGIYDIAKKRLLNYHNIQTIDINVPLSINGLQINAIPAAHEEIMYDKKGNITTIGYQFNFNGLTLYHSGDTLLFKELAENELLSNVDVALLPINGRGKGVTGNMWGGEAVRLAKAINATLTIPMHFNMFDFNTETPNTFIKEARFHGINYKILRVGESVAVKSKG